MKALLNNTEYKKILKFLHYISPRAINLREQIQTGLSNIWGYDNTLFWTSNDEGNIFNPELYGIKQNTLYEYKDHFEDLDPLHPKKLINNMPTQKIFNFTNIHSHQHFYESDYYMQFLRKHEFKDEMAVNFLHKNKLIATLGILKKNNERKFTSEDITRFKIIYELVLQKIRDHMQIEQQTLENMLYRDYMNNSNDIYIMINDQQQIIYHNEAADAFIEQCKRIKFIDSLTKQLTSRDRLKKHKQLQINLANQHYDITVIEHSSSNHYQQHYLLHITEREKHKKSISNLIYQKTLTSREAEVCQLLLKGYTNKEVANELFISINTVKKHIQNIYDKLSIRNRSELSRILLYE